MSARFTLVAAAICLPLAAVPAFADCIGDIRAVMTGMAHAGPQRIVSTIKTKADVITVVSERVPGAMHSRNENGGVVSEFTVVGDRAWSKTGDAWTEMPAEVAANFAKVMSPDSDKIYDQISDAECLGIDPRTFLLSYRMTYRDADGVVKAAIQVDPETNLPRRLKTWSSAGGEKATVTSELTYSATIAVSAPL